MAMHMPLRAYAHGHLGESLLGGFTQDMLAKRRFAVLLRH